VGGRHAVKTTHTGMSREGRCAAASLTISLRYLSSQSLADPASSHPRRRTRHHCRGRNPQDVTDPTSAAATGITFGRLPLSLSLFAVPRRFSQQNLHAASRSSHSRRSPSCRFILLSRRSPLLVLRRHRRLPLPCSRGYSRASRRNSALLAAYFGPSSLSSSPRARTTLLTPTPIICRQVMLLLRSTLVSCTSTVGVGARVPFGCIMTADKGRLLVTCHRHRFVFRTPSVRRGSLSMP